LRRFQDVLRADNAVLTLVGDFEPAEALAKIKKYFEGIPRQLLHRSPT